MSDGLLLDRVLTGMLGLALLAGTIQVVNLAVDFDRGLLGWFGIDLVAAAGFATLRRLGRRGRTVPASRALVGLLLVLSLALVLADGVERPMWSMLLAVAVVLAAALLGPREALAVAAGSGLAAVPLIALETWGPLPLDDAADPSGPETGLMIGAMLALLTAVLYLVLRERETPDVTPAPALHRDRTVDLSPREVEVVGLVAAGRSNNAIAEILVVSPKTVETHVGRAMAKTGCANRTELGVLAVREGLVPLTQ